MTRDYGDVMGFRCARLSSDAEAHREVFERAYGIGVRVGELRERRGLTQGELAERCGFPHAQMASVERGSTSPTASTLRRIADVLGVDVSELDG